MSSGIAEQVGQGLTLVYTHMLPEIVVTTEILPTSLDGTLVRCNDKNKRVKNHQQAEEKGESLTLLVRVDRSHVPLQMFAAGKALVASVNSAPVHPHVLLHTTLHDDHGGRRHPAPAGLFREVRHGHRRTQTTRSRSTHTTAAAAHAHAAGPS